MQRTWESSPDRRDRKNESVRTSQVLKGGLWSEPGEEGEVVGDGGSRRKEGTPGMKANLI